MDNAGIILIEDDIVVAQEVQRELERMGYSVPAIFTSGEEALARVREFKADLILLKLELEGSLVGAVVARRLKESADLPILFFTAYHGEKDLPFEDTTSSFGVVIRPFRECDFRATLAYALHKHSVTSALGQSWNWMTAAFSLHEEGLIVSDQKGIVRFLNDHFLRFSGWTTENVLGKPMIDFMWTGSDGVAMPVDKCVNQLPDGMGTRLPNHGTLRRRDGSKALVALRLTPVLDYRGVVFGLWVVFTPDANPLAGPMDLSSTLSSGEPGRLSRKTLEDSSDHRYVSPELSGMRSGVPSGISSKLLHESLSNREGSIFRLIVCGKSIKEISGELNLSPSTVSTYKNRILRKMHMRSTSELVSYALRQNILH